MLVDTLWEANLLPGKLMVRSLSPRIPPKRKVFLTGVRCCLGLMLIGIGVDLTIVGWPEITSWLTGKFPENTRWEKVIAPVASPAIIAIAIWFLDNSAKNRERQREERALEEREYIRADESRDQALQDYFDRLSVILLDEKVISLAVSAKKIDNNHSDTLIESARHLIRARTLSILRQFSGDHERKSAVVRFLIESQIIQLLDVSLSESDLSGVNLLHADLKCADLRKGNLEDADLRGAYLEGVKLSNAKLVGADLSAAWFNERIVIYSYLESGLMTDKEIIHADLFRADLRRAKLNGVFLLGADLGGADLRESDFSSAYLYKSDLSGADMRAADFRCCQLKEAILIGAKLEGANLGGTNLISSDLRDVSWNKKTKWPEPSLFEGAKNIPDELKKQLGL